MPLHPEVAAFLATLPPSDDSVPDPAAIRAFDAAHVPPVDERRPQLFAVADALAGEVPVRLYAPTDAATRGLIVYLHGGAFFSGSLDTHDAVARRLAEASGFAVVSAGYRLAPEAPFPAGLDDALAVLRWAVALGEDLGWDGEHLAVVGDSSGGTFAASVAATALDEGFDRITHQVLLYPSLDLDFDSDAYPSRAENAVGNGLETVTLKPWNSFYLDSGADPQDPRVSPLARADLAGLPATLVVTAEFDPLRDDGEAYAARLAEAGVPVTLRRVEGATHGFAQHFGHVPEFAAVFDEIGVFLRAEGE